MGTRRSIRTDWLLGRLSQNVLLPVIKGNDALADPNSIILTEATAKALFGDEDPFNKTIPVDNQREVKVGAICTGCTAVQPSLKFEYLMPFTGFESAQMNGYRIAERAGAIIPFRCSCNFTPVHHSIRQMHLSKTS